MNIWRAMTGAGLAWVAVGNMRLEAQPASAADPVTDPAEVRYLNATVAVVNEKIITLAQLKKEVDPLIEGLNLQVRRKTTPNNFAAVWHEEVLSLMSNALRAMVDRVLIIEEFHKKGYGMPKWVLDKAFDDSIVEKFKGDREEFLKTLAENHETQREYRQKLEDDIIVQWMRGQLRDTMSGTSPDRVKKFYDQHRDQYHQQEEIKMRQITLQPLANDPPEVLMQQANYIVQQARLPNADFVQLAKKYSQGGSPGQSGSASNWTTRNELKPTIADVVFKLAPGQVSDPIVSDGHVFIFKCEDRHEEGIQPLDQVRREIENYLNTQDAQQAEQKWLEKLRKNAYIKYNGYGPENIKGG